MVPPAASPTPDARGPLAPGLFLVSAAVLALQVLQTRILSVQMWHHHSYMVVTMTLLGFAAAGALVTVAPMLLAGNLARRLSWCGTLFAVSTIGGYFLLSKTADRAATLTAEGSYVALSVFYSYLLIPYFFGGLVVTLALSGGRDVHRLYFWNLVGSAMGAWVFIAAISALGAERLLVLCASAGPVAGVAFAARAPGCAAARRGAWGALGACALLFAFGDRWLEIEVASSKAEAEILERVPEAEVLERRWTPLCRLDVLRLPDRGGAPGAINVYQDGDAITVMHSDESFAAIGEGQLNVLAYLARGERGPGDPLRALAIGVGGGIDLRFGLARGVDRVLGIEINPETVRLVGEDYRAFNDAIYHRDGVEVRVGEGRSELRRLDETFDVIQLSGTDTYTAGTAGAYVLSESYLYTREALREYFDHLEPGGTLGIIRLAYEPPRESVRLFAIALEELRRRGVERPSRHAAVILEEVPHPTEELVVRFTGSVFSVDPLSAEAIELLGKADASPLHRVHYLPGLEAENPFTRLARAIDEGTEEAFYASYPYDVRPVADDSPFFFHFHPWSDLVGRSRFEDDWYDLTGGPVGLKILVSLLVQTSVLVTVLVLLPLALLRREGLRAPNAGRHLAYFLGLGLGFIFLEISTIQRFVLFLGHPTYSLTVVLFCFLFFAGLGSLWSRRLDARPTRAIRRVVLMLGAWIAAYSLVLDAILANALALPLPLRVAIAVALLAPMNFVMGMPFPLGLHRLKALAPRLVPWALGVNGGASVIGSIVCIVIAMESGFRAVGYAALAVYVAGMLAATAGPLSARRLGE